MSTNHDNSRLVAQAEDAINCIKDLARRGVQIQSIEIGKKPTPRIKVARRPRGLECEVVGFEGVGSTRTAILEASHQHCQIKWKETA